MLGGILTQVLESASLHDGKQTLLVAVEGFCLVKPFHTTLQPPLRQSQALGRILIVALSRRTLIKGHHDVSADDAFGVYHVLRREESDGPKY